MMTIQPQIREKNQKIIVIPHKMLVNLKNFINIEAPPPQSSSLIKSSLKRPLPSLSTTSDSCSECDSVDSFDSNKKRVPKRANLDHFTPEEKFMRRKMKNREAAQNARDKKRVKMEDMQGELEHIMVILKIKAHAQQLTL
jgi:hypothetical protein